MAAQGWDKLLADVPKYGKRYPFRIMAYSEMMPSPWEQKRSLWLEGPVQFLGAKGQTVLDSDFDVDDGGLPYEKPVLPKK